MDFLSVFTTLPDRASALALARALVERRLAACAHVEAIASVYVWDGAVQEDAEFRLLLKTRAALYPALEAAIRERHPYSLPAIFASRWERVHGPFGDWVAGQTGGGG